MDRVFSAPPMHGDFSIIVILLLASLFHYTTMKRFGTPGYLCPSYADFSTDYNATSEVFSFGIVLLEVLTGRVQFSPVKKGEKLVLQKSLSILVPDSRAGPWPEQCARRLFELAKQCVAEYEKRIKTMIAVMQQLRQIKAKYCPDKFLFQQQIATLVDQSEKLRLERYASGRKCLVCYDDELLASDGFECTANGHFVCKKNGCFAQITKDQAGSKARFAVNGYKILCTYPGCGEVVPDRKVGTYAGEEGFEAFLRAKLAANEEKVVGEYEERIRALRAEVECDDHSDDGSPEKSEMFDHKVNMKKG